MKKSFWYSYIATYLFTWMKWEQHFGGLQNNPRIISSYCEPREKQTCSIIIFLSTGRATWGTKSPTAKCTAMEVCPHNLLQSDPVLSSGNVNLSLPLGHPLRHLFSRVRMQAESFCTCPGNWKHYLFPYCVLFYSFLHVNTDSTLLFQHCSPAVWPHHSLFLL